MHRNILVLFNLQILQMKKYPLTQKNSLRLIIITLYLILISSCNEILENNRDKHVEGFDVPKTESTNQYEITYQYKEGVVVWDAETPNFIDSIVADTIIYFSLQIPGNLIPQINNVISCRSHKKVPYGLSNKVISIKKETDSYKCITSPVPLDEVFKELNISTTFDLMDSVSNKFYDNEWKHENTCINEVPNTKASIGSPNMFTINLGKDFGNAYINGTLSFGAIANIEINLKEKRSECTLELFTGMNSEFGTKKSWSKKTTIFQKDNLVNGVLSIGPVVLRPYIDAKLELIGEVEGTLKASFSNQFGIITGLKDGNIFYKNTTRNEATKIIDNIFIDAKGDLGLILTLDFGAGLYTKNIAVEIRPSIYTGFTSDLRFNNPNIFKDTPQLDFNINADVYAYFFAQLWGKELEHKEQKLTSLNLFHHNWPLLPELLPNSINVDKREKAFPLVFDAQYKLKGGLLSKFLDISPSFRVYQGKDEVYHIIDASEIETSGQSVYNFELTDLKSNTTYTGTPCLIMMGNIYDENGIEFTSKMDVTNIKKCTMTKEPISYRHDNDRGCVEFEMNVEASIDSVSEYLQDWGIVLFNKNKPVLHKSIGNKTNNATIPMSFKATREDLVLDWDNYIAKTSGIWHVATWITYWGQTDTIYSENLYPLDFQYAQKPSMIFSNLGGSPGDGILPIDVSYTGTLWIDDGIKYPYYDYSGDLMIQLLGFTTTGKFLIYDATIHTYILPKGNGRISGIPLGHHTDYHYWYFYVRGKEIRSNYLTHEYEIYTDETQHTYIKNYHVKINP